MSFILDALKKSENERARQNGPALLEARVLPPRRGVPAWAVVVGLIMAANVALLLWVLLRTPAPPIVAAAPATAVPPPVAASPPATAPAAPVQAAPPPTAAPGPPPAAVYEPPGPPPAATVVNPADYAPARPPPPVPRATAPPLPPENGAGLDPMLPSASDLSASGSGLPPLRLALHAYDADPANRYVLINSQRLREGETTSEGARVERIAPEGVLMSWRGQRFRLMPGG